MLESAGRRAKKVTMVLNVAKPLGGFVKPFARRLREYFQGKVIEKGDWYYIPPDIVLEFKLSTWYSWDEPTIKIGDTEPRGLVRITLETVVEATFKLTDEHPTEKVNL